MGKKREDFPGMYPQRCCHDCGKPTRDYRCVKCRARLRRKLHLDRDVLDLEEAEFPVDKWYGSSF